MRHALGRIWLLAVPPLAFLFKDVIATMAVLSTEPGITAEAVQYYSIALLPGALLAEGAESAVLYNVLCGAFLGVILYLWGVRRGLTRGRLP